MIIIETTDGPVMLNEREVRGLEYNKEKGDLTVTHIAREHGVMDEVVWKQMFVTSAEKFKTKKIKFI